MYRSRYAFANRKRYRLKSNSRFVRRRYSPYNTSRNSYSRTLSYPVSIPRETRVGFQYVEFFSNTSTAGLNLDQVMNLNSLFDPNRTGVGHQPQGFDQWATFYNRYLVESCDVEVIWTNAPVGGATVSIIGSNDATAITDPSVIMESPYAISKGLSAGGASVSIKKHFDLAAITGVSKTTYRSRDSFQSQFASSPSEILTLHIGSWSAVSYTFDFTVKMKFNALLFDTVQLPLS